MRANSAALSLVDVEHSIGKYPLSCAAVLMWMFANDSSNVAILDHSESGQHHTLSPKIFKSHPPFPGESVGEVSSPGINSLRGHHFTPSLGVLKGENRKRTRVALV